MLILGYILTAIAGYLLGSLPTGYLVGRGKGMDIRKVGSGNIGATNVSRTLGRGVGIFVLAVDVLKGFVACYVVAAVMKKVFAGSSDRFVADNFAIIAGFSAILGHNFTCWLSFKGGKGIATSLGVLLALFWKVALIVLGIWILVAAISRYVSLASIVAAIWLPITVMVFYFTRNEYSGRLVIISIMMGLLAVWKHKPNIERLLKGTERRIGEQVSVAPEAKQ